MTSKRFAPRMLAVAACAIQVSACAVPPKASIGTFSESLAGVMSIADGASGLDVEVEARANAISAAGRMAAGFPADFPPRKGALLGGRIDALWAERAALIKELKTYSVRLASAADPALVDGVVDAAAGLSVAVADLAAARANRIRDERKRAIAVAEALQQRALAAVVIEVGGYLADLAVAARVKQVTSQMHPVIERVRDQLKQDLVGIVGSLQLKRGSLVLALKGKLDVHAGDPKLTSVDKYDIYMAAVDELDRIDGRIAVIAGFDKVLDAMVEAHGALRDGSGDGQAFTAFLVAVRGIAAKIEAYQEAEHKLKELRRAAH